jgi:hypothetical protein
VDSLQVEEKDYLTFLPLWLRYRLVAFSGSLKYGVISHPRLAKIIDNNLNG